MVNPLVPVTAPAMMKNNFNPLKFMPSQFVQQALRFTARVFPACMFNDEMVWSNLISYDIVHHFPATC